jgi:hypothetical protein
MISFVIRLTLAIALGAAVVGSFMITRHLRTLEQGIVQNERGLGEAIKAQRVIKEQNELLPKMAAAVERLAAGLDRAIAASREIRIEIREVSEANRVTLQINGELERSNRSAEAQMVQVVDSLRRLRQTAALIQGYLTALRDTAANDLDRMKAIAANAARMNLRTPGVVEP